MAIPVFVCVTATGPATQRNLPQTPPKPLSLKHQAQLIARSPAFIRHMLSYAFMTLGVAIISGGILFITADIALRKALSGQFDPFLPQEVSDISAERAIQLGLNIPEGGYTNRAGQSVSDDQVQQIDPTQDKWVEAIDFTALNASPYGREQADAINSLFKTAISAQTSGLAKILVGLAGFFSAVFALFLLGAILSQALWVPLAKAIGRDRALMIALGAYGLFLIAYLFILCGGNLDLIIYGAFFLGVCNGAYQNLPSSHFAISD